MEHFAIVNKHLDEIYEKEPETLKQEIQKAIDELCKAKDTEWELSTSVIAAEESFGPKEYLLYVLYHLLQRLD